MLSRPLILLLLIVPLVVGGCDRQSRGDRQARRAARAAAAMEATGSQSGPKVVLETIGTLDRSHKGEAVPDLAFMDPTDQPVTLASFAGKPLLLNLWATWCAPCVAEMPTLDALAGRLDGQVTVLTVSQDLEGAAKVDPFFSNAGFNYLQPYRDPQAALSISYRANLPTTILIDSTGHEVWRMTGGMDWTGTKAAELVAEAK